MAAHYKSLFLLCQLFWMIINCVVYRMYSAWRRVRWKSAGHPWSWRQTFRWMSCYNIAAQQKKSLQFFWRGKRENKTKIFKILYTMAPISPILAAVSIAGANTRTFPTSSEPCFSRSNITAQRRLFSTKKTSKKKRNIQLNLNVPTFKKCRWLP